MLTLLHRSAAATRWRALVSLIAQAITTRSQRRHLGQLDPHLLCDIGLSGAQATAEARRPVWDVPSHWTR